MPSVLVMTPQIEELTPLLAEWRAGGLEHAAANTGRMACISVPALDLLIAVGGNGKAQFALQSQHLIDRCPDARLLICAGAAGGLTTLVRPGDVVVATATVEHDYHERFVTEPLPRHESDSAVLHTFREIVRSGHLGSQDLHPFPFTVHFGPVASGDEDVVDEVRAVELREATGALCVAWEGSGGARAARFSGIPFVEVRAITDAADAQAPGAFRANLDRAMIHAARLLLAWRTADLAAR